MINVAYCIDRAVAVPMRISLYSALSHLNPQECLSLHVFHDQLPIRDQKRIERLCDQFNNVFSVAFYDLNLELFNSLPSLQGNYVAYGRLVVPQAIEADRIIYLDADTLPLCDLSELALEKLDGKAVGAVDWGETVSTAMQSAWYRKVGMSSNDPVCNTGVLLIDRHRWISSGLTEKCLEIGHEYGSGVEGADQPIINAALDGDFKSLPWRYNVRAGPEFDAELPELCIVHFVGSFKPWYPFARWVHSLSDLYGEWAKKTAERKTTYNPKRWVHIAGSAVKRLFR